LTHLFYQKSKELSRAFSFLSRPEAKNRPQQQNGKLFFVYIDHAKPSDPQKRFHVVTVEKMLNIVHKKGQAAKAIRSLRSLPPLL
jgi:hypothetical protein